MKEKFVAIVRPVCRLIAAALWQLVWLLPVYGAYWYGKSVLPSKIAAHFQIDQTRDRLASLERLADQMKQHTSLTNPAMLSQYLSTQLAKMSVSLKLNTLETTNNFLQTLCSWTIHALWILAVVYAVFRAFKAYQARTQTHMVAKQVVHEMNPQMLLLQREMIALREEVHSLKQSLAIASDLDETEQLMPSHE